MFGRIGATDFELQADKIPWVYYCFPGLHLAILERARELVVCCQLVEHWRHDCYFAPGDSLSILLCVGTSEGEGEGEDAVKSLEVWNYVEMTIEEKWGQFSNL
jgi:hypothetical protein